MGDKLPMRQFCPHPALLHVDPFPPIIDEDLQPGDILYIPPGFPHDGITHETALNYSVGFRGPNSRDLISSFADYVLENDLGGEHYSDPDLTCREHPGRVEEYELERLRTMMIDMIRQPEDFKQWFGSFVTTRVTSWILRRRNHRMKKRKWSMRCWVVKAFPPERPARSAYRRQLLRA